MSTERVALLVELRIRPGDRDAFVERVRRHAALCRRVEPGCLEFAVLVPDEESDVVVLCEVYTDDAAVEHHLSTPHMAAYLEETGPMIAQRHRRRCRAPEPIG